MVPRAFHDWGTRQLARFRHRVQQNDTGVDAAPASEAARLATELEGAATKLAADRLAFMSALSHALLTPLNNIYGYTQLLDAGMRGPLTGDQRHDVRRIQANERHLVHLVNSVISFARWEDEETVELEDVSVHAAVRAATGIVAHVASKKHVQHATDVSAIDASVIVRAEPTRLHAILLHLLLNAIKFSPDGNAVAVHVLGVGECVWIRVTDTGIGISPAEAETIFRPFERADDAYVSEQEGDGLGLSISRKLARAMGGEITVASVVGHGSTFTLSLPRGRGEAPAA